MNIAAVSSADIQTVIDLLPEDLRSAVTLNWYKNEEEAKPHLDETEIIVTTGKASKALILAAPKLRWIQSLSAGVDGFPFSLLAERGIALTNARGIHQIQMSEFALALMLQWARRFPEFYRNQANRLWEKKVWVSELAGCTLGILGAGSIGQAIAAKAKAFDMRVIGYNRSGQASPGFDQIHAGRGGLEHVLRESDYLVVLVPHTAETHHMLAEREFRLMKPGAFFINLARGSVVNEKDLIAALKEGVIAGAALDVFETEPLPADSPLWGMENVIITPHVAGLSPQYMQRASAIFYENIRRFRNGEPLMNAIDLAAGY